MRILLRSTLVLLLFFSGKAYAQNYNMGNSSISTCSGNFYDSGGNGAGAGANYNNNENYTMTFCSSTPGQCVRLTFTAFNIESGFDYLRIYNGSTTGAPLLGTYTGTTSPGTVTATSGCLTLQFTSDGSINYAGWAATVSCVTCPGGPCGSTCSGGPAPANDACSGAQNLGLLPVPASCPSGVGTPLSLNTTNLCATAEMPYTSMLGCQPTGNMASPASDVWYQFSITGPTLNINLTGLQTPEVGLYSGSNCNNLVPRGCAIGASGTLNTSFGGLAPGTYWLQVSGGNLNDQCNFNLQLQNNFDCAGCVMVSNLTVNPPPVNGTYQAGQLVNFCYTISDYNQTSVNWLHAVIPSFSAGWDLSTLTTTMPANCSGAGAWTWNNGLVTSSATGLVVGPGFFYESALGSPGGVMDGNPGNNFGDNNALNTCDWTFCFSIRTLPPGQCIPGLPLNIAIDTYGDGETGSWTSFACSGDPITQFFAQLACCTPPVVNDFQPPCPGSTGSAVATGQGVAPWNYIWRNGGGTVIQTANNINGSNTLSNLSPGTYSVTVTDDAGCTSTATFTINNATPVTAAGNITNLSCSGANNGAIAVTPSGGTGPYTYAWNPNVGTTANPTGLAAGTYTVTVTDANGCTGTQTFTVTQAPPVTASIAPTAVSCYNGTNGSATVTPGGGTGPYTYSWSPTGGSGATASGLAPGSYVVTVTDSRGCTTTASTTITQPTQITAQINSSTNVTCNGGSNGTATAAGNGGTPGYTYAWAPSGGSGATGTGLAAGNYTVTITDTRGCTATANITITQPPVITATIQNVTNVTCNGAADGSAGVNAGGGNPGYTYAWTPSGGNSSTASGLGAGTYTVTVTDASGCTRTATANITQPPALTASVTPTPADCNGATDGSVSANAGGGTGPYSYNWLPAGGTAATATGLGAGTYTVTITDANGCTRSATGAVTEPSAITYTSNTTPATCGAADGSATITPAGGTGPYSYSWTPSGGSGSTATNIPAGAYNVTITDANGCTVTAAVGVSNTNSATVAINASTDVSCNGGSDGTATATISGGSAPFTYAWSPSGGAGATANGLQAGNYTVTVTDVNGCSATANIAINEPPLLTSAISAFADVVCAGDATGTATVLANGGSPGYSYAWTPAGGSGTTASNLAGGTYTVTVTDAAGCTSSTTVSINEPTPVTAAVTPTNITCNGAANGSANATPGGGTGPYTYTWSPSGGSGASASGLGAGSYTVTITDAAGCTATASANIAEPAALIANLTPADVSCFGASDGSVAATIAGGTAPLAYSWSPSGGSGATASGLGQGSYTVTVTDASGCTVSATAAITEPPQINALITNSTSLLCNGDGSGSATVSANGGSGALSYTWSPTGGNGTTASGLDAGNYTVTVTDANGCTITAAVTINEPPVLTSAITASTDLLCNAGADGSATVTANGGTAPYAYTWSPSGGAGTTATGLSGGNYSVLVTDGNGCTSSSNITINEPPAIQLNVNGTDATCGMLNGSATVSVNGGTPTYSYNWTPVGGTAITATGLDAGNYTIEVTDANGCIQRANVSLTNSLPPVTSSSVTSNVNCNGGSNGAATVSVSQGTAPINYSWSPSGGSGSSASNLQAGFYTVTVTDALGCTATENITITEPPVLTSSITGGDVVCGGLPTGYAAVDASGGTPGYSYSWAPGGAATDSIASLTGGNYTVTVTDANGCTSSAAITVAEPPVLTTSTASSDVSCLGISDGSATTTANGGTGAYTYNWAPSGGSGAAASGLGAGTYTVTVTDANGCTVTNSVTVAEPTQLNAALTTSSMVSCNGGNDATAAITAAGGTVNYSYNWAPSGGTAANATGLSAGNYTVTVTDANGCTVTVTVPITEPTLLTSNIPASTNILCNGGNNGDATVNANGGTPGYSYSWSPVGGTGTLASGLQAGNYTVTVTDANGCTSTAAVTITEPPLLTSSPNPVTDVACNGGNDGAASVTIAGGSPGYTYAWSPSGGTGANATSLTAGNYTVTATDANGCTVSSTFLISEPTLLSPLASSTDALCSGANNGTASVATNGGTPGYTYSWTPSGGTGANATGLGAGVYQVVVTDANGCTASATAIISEPSVLVLNVAGTSDVSCFNGADGTGSVTPTGGTANYSYAWSPSGGTGSSANGLSAGSYTVTVTDQNGCTAQVPLTINQPTQLTVQASAIDARCNGSTDGSISAIANGGTGPYGYTWSPGGAVTAGVNNVGAGNYSVTITDANGCTTTGSATVAQPAALNASATPVAVTCNGGSNGTVTVNVNGGTTGYSYSWFPGGATTANASGLSAGAYSVTITDANGCTTTAAATVTEPLAMQLSLSSTPSVCGGTNGSASVSVAGGTGPYSYSWSPGGGAGSTINNVGAGAYSVLVTDANGCTQSDIANVGNTGGPTVSASVNQQVSCAGGNDGRATVTVSSGTAPYSYAWSPSGGNGATANSLPAGNYSVTVTDANGCISSDNIVITEPSAVAAQVSSTPTLCAGSSDGSMTAQAAGGTGAYTFSWSPGGAVGATASGLAAGTYTVTATDANGCTSSASGTVTSPGALTASASSTPTLCNGGNDGTATAIVNGGTAGYTYSWFPSGASGGTAAGLSPGNYTVTVTDANGCTTTASATVGQPAAMNLSTNSTPAQCGSSNGSASVNASGGSAPYNYLWNPSGATTQNATGLSAGAYSVVVTDANGCTQSDVANVGNIGGPTVSASTVQQVSCNGGSDGSATVSVSSGNAPFAYTWAPAGGTLATATGLPAGSYSVTVMDANGCISTDNVTITEPSPVQAQASATAALCRSTATGAVSAQAAGGTGPYTYLWMPGSIAGASASNLNAGTYTVTVSDQNGCTSTATASVTQPTAVTASTSTQATQCNGSADGSATVSANGGTPGYTYSWFPTGGNNSTTIGVAAGTYTVTVTDDNGCSITSTAVVGQPAAINVSTSSTPASCGSANGSATASVSGGAGSYSYAWSPGGATGANASGLVAGSYTVIVTDANGCTQTANASVSNIGGPTIATAVVQQVSCFGGNDGSATVNVSTGTAPFSFAWSPAGGSGATATGLSAGNFSVTVTDANGCISNDQVTITEPTALALQTTTQPTLCFGSPSGSADVVVAGGTGPYSYAWAPGGASSASAINLSAGNYTVTITDANGCTAGASATVAQPVALAANATATATDCNGGSDGTASVSVSGGTAGYSYAWFPSGSSGSTATGLSAGNYTVTVTDANGCTTSATATVTQPVAIQLTTSSTPSACSASNGSATVNVNGGSAPYTYSWSSGGSVNATANNLPAGSYTVIVTDANGCTNSASAVVANQGGPTVSLAATSNVSCNGASDGSASINVNGGTGPFTYQWSPYGGNSTSASGLGGGNYVVSVTDANGCLNFVNVSIQEPDAIQLQTNSTPTTCGGSNGTASVLAAGGTGSFTYAWTPGSGNNANLTNLASGNYSVVVTDGNGCTQSANVTVSSIGGATATLQSYTDVSCNGGANGSATISATGGTAPYTYSWSPTGGTLASASGLAAGSYQVQITDATGCVSTVQVLIEEPDPISILTSSTPASCNGGTDGSATASPSGGTPPYQYQWSPGGASTPTAGGLAAGLYTVVITDAGGCNESESVAVNSNTSMVLTPTSTNVGCNGMANGSAAVSVSGGAAPYSYSWSPAVGSGATASGLSGGNYTVTVSDANGCVNLNQFEIEEPAPLLAALPADQALCPGFVLVLATSVSGGTQPYAYLWTDGSTDSSQTVSPVGTTQYGVTVTDANGCSSGPLSVTISVPDPLTVVATGDATLCDGSATTIGSQASGGAGTYTYSWNSGQILTPGSTVYPAQDTTFTVTVTDACGTTATDQVTVLVRPAPEVAFTPQEIAGCSPVVVNFLDGSTTPAGSTYAWNLGDGSTSSETSPIHTYTEPGTYSVSLLIETPDGCIDYLNVSNLVTVHPYPVAGFSASADTVSLVNANVSFENTSSGASWYAWDFGDGSPVEHGSSAAHNYADTGTYQIQLIVMNPAGCLDTIFGTIRVEQDFAIYIPNAFTPNKDGVNDGFLPLGVGWTDFEMWIMDRWGLVIFHSTSPETPWNGSYQNNEQPCQQDVYEYIVSVKDFRGKGHRYVGHVTLVR